MVRIVRADQGVLAFTVPFDIHSVCEAFQISLCFLRDRGINDILAMNRLFSRLLSQIAEDTQPGCAPKEATFCIEPSSRGAYRITSKLSGSEMAGEQVEVKGPCGPNIAELIRDEAGGATEALAAVATGDTLTKLSIRSRC